MFLGADPSTYDEARSIGLRAGNVSGYRADGPGARAAFASLSRGSRAWRGKERARRRLDVDDFFDDRKEAELDRRRRQTR